MGVTREEFEARIGGSLTLSDEEVLEVAQGCQQAIYKAGTNTEFNALIQLAAVVAGYISMWRKTTSKGFTFQVEGGLSPDLEPEPGQLQYIGEKMSHLINRICDHHPDRARAFAKGSGWFTASFVRSLQEQMIELEAIVEFKESEISSLEYRLTRAHQWEEDQARRLEAAQRALDALREKHTEALQAKEDEIERLKAKMKELEW